MPIAAMYVILYNISYIHKSISVVVAEQTEQYVNVYSQVNGDIASYIAKYILSCLLQVMLTTKASIENVF